MGVIFISDAERRVEAIAGHWEEDRTLIAFEFSFNQRLLLLSLVGIGSFLGITLGSMTLKITVMDGVFCKPINTLTFMEEISASSVVYLHFTYCCRGRPESSSLDVCARAERREHGNTSRGRW